MTGKTLPKWIVGFLAIALAIPLVAKAADSRGTAPSVASAPADAFGGQKTCPVTGKTLGDMGKPIAVDVGGGQTIFVCCKGCVSKVKANPEFYLKKVQDEKGTQK